MSKELEALNDLFDLVTCQGSFEKAQRCFDIVEEALNRLESIDNSNPSEALECLELIGKVLRYVRMLDDYDKEFSTIKQALLKAQDPKQYLTWENLEKDRTYKVLLNGIQYELVKRYDDYEYRCDYITLQKKPNVSIYIYEYEKEIFNDLHLEAVEE